MSNKSDKEHRIKYGYNRMLETLKRIAEMDSIMKIRIEAKAATRNKKPVDLT